MNGIQGFCSEISKYLNDSLNKILNWTLIKFVKLVDVKLLTSHN